MIVNYLYSVDPTEFGGIKYSVSWWSVVAIKIADGGYMGNNVSEDACAKLVSDFLEGWESG